MPQVASNGPRCTWRSVRLRTLRVRVHVADEHVEHQPTVHKRKSFKTAKYDDVDKQSAKVDTEAERQAPSRPSFFYRYNFEETCTGKS